jgi:hypothetical protein
MKRVALKWIPKGWIQIEPDLGVGIQFINEEAIEDSDVPSISAWFYDDEYLISYRIGGFGLSKSISQEGEWDGQHSSIAPIIEEAERLGRSV